MTTNETAVTGTPVTVIDKPKGKVGAPPKVIKWPRGAFTVAEAVEENPHIKAALTIRKRIETMVLEGFLVEIESLKTGKVGKPASRFIRAAVWHAAQNRKKDAVPVESAAEPVPAVSVTPEAVATEVVATEAVAVTTSEPVAVGA